MRDADSFMSWQRDVPVRLRLAETGPLSETPVSVMTAFRKTAEDYPNHPALGLSTCHLFVHWPSISTATLHYSLLHYEASLLVSGLHFYR